MSLNSCELEQPVQLTALVAASLLRLIYSLLIACSLADSLGRLISPSELWEWVNRDPF